MTKLTRVQEALASDPNTSDMDNFDREVLRLMAVMKRAIEAEVSEIPQGSNGEAVLDAQVIVEAHLKSVAYWLGMSSAIDDTSHLLDTIASLGAKLLRDTYHARQSFKHFKKSGMLPENVQIIDE